MAESAPATREDHPLDFCECAHDRKDHGPRCAGLDSYGVPCTCPSFVLWIEWS